MYGRPRRRGVYGPIERRPWSEKELAERLEGLGIDCDSQRRVVVSHNGHKANRRIDLAVGQVGIEVVNTGHWLDDPEVAERAFEIIEQGYSLIYVKIAYSFGELSDVPAFIAEHIEALEQGMDCPYVGINYEGTILEWGRPMDGELKRHRPVGIGPAPAPHGYPRQVLWEDYFRWHPKTTY